MRELDLVALVRGIVLDRLTGAEAGEAIAARRQVYAMPHPALGLDPFIEWEDRAHALVADVRAVISGIDGIDRAHLRPFGDTVVAAAGLVGNPVRVCLALGERALALDDIDMAIHFFTLGARTDPDSD